MSVLYSKRIYKKKTHQANWIHYKYVIFLSINLNFDVLKRKSRTSCSRTGQFELHRAFISLPSIPNCRYTQQYNPTFQDTIIFGRSVSEYGDEECLDFLLACILCWILNNPAPSQAIYNLRFGDLLWNVGVYLFQDNCFIYISLFFSLTRQHHQERSAQTGNRYINDIFFHSTVNNCTMLLPNRIFKNKNRNVLRCICAFCL